MSDKHLTVKEWQKFSSGGGYKDAAWLKALSAVEKSAGAAAAEQLQALDALEAAGRSLLKLHRGDDKLVSYLDDVDAQLKKVRKDAQKTQAKDDKAAGKAGEAEDSEEDEEEKGPALLDPKRLLLQLTLCRKNPARRVQFAFVDGKDKAPALVAMSPKQTGRKIFGLLCEEAGVKTGAFGSAWVDGTELMLQLDKTMGGLAKKMRAPIKACGFRITKVVLWSADGTILEQDAAPEEAEGAAAGSAQAAPPAAPAAAAAEMAAFTARLKTQMVGIAAAGASLEGKAARLLATEAGAQARQGDFAAAKLSLDKIDKLLARLATVPQAGAAKADAAASESAAAKSAAAASVAAAAAAARSAAWKAAREHWQEANDSVNDQLNRLRAAILAAIPNEPEYADALHEIADKGLNAMTGNQRVKLAASIQSVDDGSSERMQAHGAKTLELITAFSSFLETSDQIDGCDANPWDVDVSIRDTLAPALQELASALQMPA